MDWEVLFERELIPLVAAAQSEAALEKTIGVVLNALFRRSDETANREQFWALLQISLARGKSFGEKLDNAVDFLRLVKSTRTNLATQSPNRRVAEGVVSSDMNRVAQRVAPAPVPVSRPAAVVSPPVKPPPVQAPAAPPPAVKPPAAVKAPATATASPAVKPPATAKPAPAAAAEKAPDFAEVFDTAICGYLLEVLSVLRVEQPGSLRLPALVHPAFAAALEQTVRAHVLPEMRNSRHIKNLADSFNWQEEGRKELLRILTAGEINNPILHTWDGRWGDLAARRLPGKTGKTLTPHAKALWKDLASQAEAGGYAPLPTGDVTLFLTLPRYDLERLKKAWREIDQLYQQEFRPGKHQEQARDGALRDGLLKWEGREGMPPHALEWLAIKACCTLPLLDLAWLERFSTCKGKTKEERQRAIPYIMQVVG